jgi:hypothetical protein
MLRPPIRNIQMFACSKSAYLYEQKYVYGKYSKNIISLQLRSKLRSRFAVARLLTLNDIRLWDIARFLPLVRMTVAIGRK